MSFGSIQATIRSVTGTTQTYEGDWHAWCDKFGFAAGTWSERMTAVAKAIYGAYGGAAENSFLETGTAPTMALDFTQMTALPSSVTFSRADATTCATYFGSDGLLKTAAANIPRFDYDPVTLSPKGLLIEESRANLLLQSNSFATTWTEVGTGVRGASADVVGIDGLTSAWTLTDNDAASSEFIHQSATLTATNHTFSVYIKKTTGTQSSYPVIQLFDTVSLTALCTVDTTNGTATVWTAYTGRTIQTSSATCTSTGSYWRVTLTFLATAASWRVGLFPAGSTSATQATGIIDVSAQGSAVFTCAQLELGSFPTSYIPTTTTAVTRAADSASMTSTSFSSWWNATEGTFLAKCDVVNNNAAATRRVLEVNDNTSANRILLGFNATTTSRFLVTVTTTQADVTETITAGVPVSTAGAYKASSFSGASNGVAGTPVSSGSVPTVDRLWIGNDQVGSATTNLNGHISRLIYWPKRLPDATLRSLTT